MTFSVKAATTRQLSLLSPAKVNLFFRVLGKREDGFHEIASLYQAISLFDRMHISLAEQDMFTCTDSGLDMGKTNLISRALDLFRHKTGHRSCFRIHLEKNIPIEAGLGGGSSNAATALFAFSSLTQSACSIEELQSWGGEIGSDIPFFLSHGTAWGRGRGEVIEELSFAPSFPLTIVKPSWGLSTPAVYRSSNPAALAYRNPTEDLKQWTQQGKQLCYNDLEEAAFSLSPELKIIRNTLLSLGFSQVVLCGSGTAFFCLGASTASLSAYLPQCRFFSVRTLQRKGISWYE